MSRPGNNSWPERFSAPTPGMDLLPLSRVRAMSFGHGGSRRRSPALVCNLWISGWSSVRDPKRCPSVTPNRAGKRAVLTAGRRLDCGHWQRKGAESLICEHFGSEGRQTGDSPEHNAKQPDDEQHYSVQPFVTGATIFTRGITSRALMSWR